MKNEYYPFSHEICHHFYDNDGCVFCGYHSQKRSVSEKSVSLKEMTAHFDSFVDKNIKDIKKSERLVIAPNGSWFTLPKRLRKHIYRFISKHEIPWLKYEARATLFNPKKARREFEIAHKDVEKYLGELIQALGEIKPNHIVSFGLEVADNGDLKRLNKGCCLEDYVNASCYVHKVGAKVCVNILLAPPRVKNPVYKAFETARFGAEELGASEFNVMPCTPMKGTKAYIDWVEARWNPISATAASEIFRIIKMKYPDKRVRYLDLRVFSKHGRHGKFKRKPGKWSEEEKGKERKKVRRVAKLF